MSVPVLVSTLIFMSMAFAVQSAWLNKKLASTPFFRWLDHSGTSKILQLIYFVGLPYLALLSGLIPARLFGLKGWDSASQLFSDAFSRQLPADWQLQLSSILKLWASDVGILAGILASLTGVGIIFGWLYLRGGKIQSFILPSFAQWIIDIIHWSFYRAVIWRITDDLYLSVLGGIVLILVEYLLVYKVGGESETAGSQRVIRFAGNVMMAIGFLFAPNLWVMGILFLIALQFANVLMIVYQRTK